MFAALSAIMAILTGLLITWTRRFRWALLSGASSYMIGLLILCFLPQELPLTLSAFVLAPTAFGQGLQYPSTFIALLTLSSYDERAIVTSTLLLYRGLGMVLGIALSSLAVQNALLHYLKTFVHGELRDEVIDKVRDSVTVIAQLEEPYREQVILSFGAALRMAFIGTTVAACLSLLLLIPLRLPRLKSTSSVDDN